MVSEQTKENLSRLLNVIESRKDDFRGALVAFALSGPDNQGYRVTFGLIRFMGRDETVAECDYDWGRFRIVQKVVPVETAVKQLRSTWEEEHVQINGMMPIHVQSNLHDLRQLSSHEQYGYFHKEWPGLFGYADIHETTNGAIKHEYLSRLGLPMYPDEEEAIADTMGLDLLRSWQLTQRIEVWVPDFRARIRTLRIEGKKISAEVESGLTPIEDVRIKFFSRGEKQRSKSSDLLLEGSVIEFVAEEPPVRVEAHLLSVKDGTLIDRVGYDNRYPSREGAILGMTEKDILDIISHGENEQVEFKEKVNREKPTTLMATFVAFANTKGGVILLGVDDNGRVRGVREDYSQMLTNWVHSLTDPPVEMKVRDLDLQGKRITVVEVPEGDKKPYLLVDEGPYVRRGATDKPVKRSELDDMRGGQKGVWGTGFH